MKKIRTSCEEYLSPAQYQQFNTEKEATLSWAGKSFQIERFNFSFGDKNHQLLGEWVLTIGDTSFPVYFGERVAFSKLSQEGMPMGSRTGRPSAIIAANATPDSQEFDFVAIMDSSTSFFRGMLIRFAGLNKIEGLTALVEKPVSTTQIAVETLNGLTFVGYRNHGAFQAEAARAGNVKQSGSFASDEIINQISELIVPFQKNQRISVKFLLGMDISDLSEYFHAAMLGLSRQ